MTIDSYQPHIRKYLEENGPTGVNELSKAVNIPLSTLQYYLDKKQTYFKKNNQRKWVLPETHVSAEISVVSDKLDGIIDSQLSSINVLVNTLMSQFNATVTLLQQQKMQSTPVAEIPRKLDKRLITMQEDAEKVYSIFKAKKSDIPEEYRSLILNLDYIGLVLTYGFNFTLNLLENEIYSLVAGKDNTLTDETINIIKECQKK